MDAKSLAELYSFNDFVINANTEGVSNAESLLQPRDGGNCMNWVLGHIVQHRNDILKYAGGEPVVAADRIGIYASGEPPPFVADMALPFDEILAAYRQSQEQLTARFGVVSPERLAEPAANERWPDKTIGQMLAGLMFHEAYHAGQLGLLRRMMGKKGALV